MSDLLDRAIEATAASWTKTADEILASIALYAQRSTASNL
jgi:hypothetical protein